MRTLPKHLSRHPIYLVCALASASLFLSGCGKSKPDAAAKKAGKIAAAESTPGNAIHTHDGADETCFICDPSKRDKGRLWCKEHGRYEDRCWLCHSELEDKSRLFCKEHSLYEDECHLCHPELKSDKESARNDPAEPGDGGARSAGLYCNEHRVPERECGICQPELAASMPPGGNLQVRLPSLQSADKAGLRTERPRFAEAAPAIRAFCEVRYNLNAMAKVAPLAGGIVHAVRHDIGDQVERGDVLVVLRSADVASAKSDYLSAIVDRDIRRQTFEREKRLKEQEISTESEFLDAEAAYRTASLALSNLRQKLLNLGMTEDELARIANKQEASADLDIRAPFAGTLIERSAAVGEAIDMGHPLFTIADLSTHWLALSIPSDQIGQIRLEQRVEARFPELPGATYVGRITWVDTAVDPRSRMVRARAEVVDETGLIKTGLFGDARILTGDVQPAAMVPREAVQRHEGGAFVFVQNEPDLYSLRRVTLGETSGDTTVVMAGLAPNDPVVTDGSFIVMSEFLKSRLGAGCVDD
ncbi:MAG: efflux RND transporter periplasmic adaptor subunit [Verrucomicrobia bacterium]|nr:efflux RND transporter periplasmic adaptor subunit [Verrucomicrobiota bacterium]MDA1085705.1 efflux RND transporter periplasmic adaptor subunit [Verrucomicrobiota bacterium]